MTLFISEQIALNEMVKKLKRIWKEAAVMAAWHLPEETEENHIELWTAGVSAEIWTEHMLRTSVEHCSYTNLLGFNMRILCLSVMTKMQNNYHLLQ
jgi:hypothetical protein